MICGLLPSAADPGSLSSFKNTGLYSGPDKCKQMSAPGAYS